MSTLQKYLVSATQKMADEMTAAFLNLPEDKRSWSPSETARTALDQMAECAILCGYTADLIQTRVFMAGGGFDAYFRHKSEVVAQGWEVIEPMLRENVYKLIAVIETVPDSALAEDVEMPWGKQTMEEIVSYPYWNMTYHLGQINYIASILGCLP